MRQTLVTYFTELTAGEFKNSSKEYLGHFNKVHKFKKGDVALLINIETKCIFGIAILGEYEDGKIYREHHQLDVDTYTGENSKYNKYDIKIEKLCNVNIAFKDLAILCGKTEDDKVTTNIWKSTHLNYSNVFYKGEDSEIVLQRLNILINTLLSVQ